MSEIHSKRVEAVHALRGVAALAVALYHFSGGNQSFYVPSGIKVLGSKGWLGIEVFFVISGFILPYSLWKANYTFSRVNIGRFISKRIIRLVPPYFATIALVLVLGYLSTLSPAFTGKPFKFDAFQLTLHAGYLNGYFQTGWLNPAFWTLAIECQFYLLIALVYPFVVSPNILIRRTIIACLLSLAPLSDLFPGWAEEGVSVIFYLPLFVCGIVTFQVFTRTSSQWEGALVLAVAAWLLWARMGMPVMVVGLVAPVMIVALPSWTTPWLASLGNLSYSLYLVHIPIGGRVINLAERLPPSGLVAVAGITAATALSLCAAYVLNRFVERPAQRYAGSLKFERAMATNTDSQESARS